MISLICIITLILLISLAVSSNQLDYFFSSSDCNITQEELNNLCNHILRSQTPNVEEYVAYVQSVVSDNRDDYVTV